MVPVRQFWSLSSAYVCKKKKKNSIQKILNKHVFVSLAVLYVMDRLSQVLLIDGNITICNHSVTTTHLMGDSSSAAEFFVGIGVVCFLYSMVALLVYLGYMHVYKDSDFGPIFVSK